jgi:hypothetical protein
VIDQRLMGQPLSLLIEKASAHGQMQIFGGCFHLEDYYLELFSFGGM